MKIVIVHVAQGIGAPPKYRLKDEHSGIVYPNLLTFEQANSPTVHDAAATFIKVQIRRTNELRLHLCSLPPLFLSMLNLTRLTSGRMSAHPEVPSTMLTTMERKLIDEIKQLKEEIAHLQERNDRQASVIKAVQDSVLVRGVK